MSTNAPRLPVIVALGMSAIAALIAAPRCHAQALEEVVVTAQKREQRVEDIGMAVTAIAGEQIKRLNLRDLTDVAQQSPSLSVASPLGAASNQNFVLRGVGLNDFSEHNESPVATYMDGVYQATTSSINGSLFDTQRVEVLSGPQGTLYGRNSTGGIVHMISNRPSATPDGYAEVQAGSYNEKRFEGAIGGALSDTFRARASLLIDNHDGYRPSTFHGDGTPLSPLSVKAADANDLLAGRLQLEYLPSQATSVLFSTHASTNHTTGPSYYNLASMYAADGHSIIATPPDVVNPWCANIAGLQGPGQDCLGYRNTNPNLQQTETNRSPYALLDTFGASATVNTSAGGFDFTSISAYERVHKLYGEDTDNGPAPGIAYSTGVDSRQLTQEFRLARKSERIYLTTGLYYFHRDFSATVDTDVSGIGLIYSHANDRLKSDSTAAFAQLEYSLSPHFTAIGGLRFTHENQSYSTLVVDLTGLTPVFLGNSAVPVPGYNLFPYTGGAVADPTPYSNSRVDNLLTYRGELDWRPNDSLLTYASISRGTKSAGWNATIDGSGLLGASTPADLPFKPEELLAYELGFKKSIGARVRLNGAAFYYDYRDFQAFTFQGIVQQVSNLPAKVTGVEFQLMSSLTKHFDLTLAGNALDSTVKGVRIQIATAPSESVVQDSHMALAPRYTVTGVMRYHVPVGDHGEVAFQFDSRYEGKQYLDLQNNPVATIGGRAISNASIAWSGHDEKWTASLWAKNVMNLQYFSFMNPFPAFGWSQTFVGAPRWVGVTFRHRW